MPGPQEAITKLDLMNDDHMQWLVTMYQLLCKFDRTMSNRHAARRKTTDLDESEMCNALARHATACPAMNVQPDDAVHYVADHWDLAVTTASMLAYHQHVHMPAAHAAATRVAARWRGIVARREWSHMIKTEEALLEAALP